MSAFPNSLDPTRCGHLDYFLELALSTESSLS